MLRTWNARIALVAVGAALAYGGSLLGDGPAPAAAVKLPIDGDDLAGAAMLDVYKFQLPAVRGRAFDVVVRVTPAAGAAPQVLFRETFTPAGIQAPVVRVSLLPADGRFAGFLLSDAKLGKLQLACDGCSPRGLTTALENPLRDVPPVERFVMTLPSERFREGAKPNETILLKAVRIDRKPGAKVHPQEAYPRLELLAAVKE